MKSSFFLSFFILATILIAIPQAKASLIQQTSYICECWHQVEDEFGFVEDVELSVRCPKANKFSQLNCDGDVFTNEFSVYCTHRETGEQSIAKTTLNPFGQPNFSQPVCRLRKGI